MKIYEVLNEIESIREEVIHKDDLVVDVCDVLEGLKGYESYMEITDELIDEYGLEHYKTDNTYNWNSCISNDLAFDVYTDYDGQVLVCMRVHKFGDIRGNYTDDIYLEFSDLYTFESVMLEVGTKNVHVELNDKIYEVEVSIVNDVLTVYDEDNEYVCDVYTTNMEDLIREIEYATI